MNTPISINRAFMRTNAAHRKLCSAAFAELGISKGQPKVLDFLVSHEGCTQKEIATHCHIEPATVTSLLTSLEKLELLYRIQNKEDKRIWNVYLTDTGRQKQKQVASIFQQMKEISLKGFSEEEAETLITLLGRVYANLSESEPLNIPPLQSTNDTL